MAARFLGHPIHQALIAFPLGLLGGAVLFDIVAIVISSPGLLQASYYMIAAGVISGLVAAPFGLVDWLGIPSGTRAKFIGAVHGLGNVVVLVLFAASWLLRRPDAVGPSGSALGFSSAGLLLALVTGWLGGELVDRLGVGVDEGAHVNAPSSLSGRPAGAGRV
ncbi:MAG TPA: DUF2231 domain-containing protein [Gemmatimonadaceae bacterium]|jgi:uncharacterized membrane protein|nr:DUF2231 domain-containing protein [Gemmatimonadaceae bacterium]